jgi:triosephosphate isomerase
MRTRFIGGNWKMYRHPAGAASFFERFLPLAEQSRNCQIVIFPGFLDLDSAVEAALGTRIQIGAQNLHWATEGAFTGEVSGLMIRASGCSHVIVGHSERRRYFGETSETVLKKTVAALDAGLTPIICVGEIERNDVQAVLQEQFQRAIGALSNAQFQNIIIAYEPAWAIGTGETATPEIASAAHRFLRAQAKESFGDEAAANVRILYGGSVKAESGKVLIAQPEIDGFLVGGASRDPAGFASIVDLATCPAL